MVIGTNDMQNTSGDTVPLSQTQPSTCIPPLSEIKHILKVKNM
jgi:hypothetical protein